MSHIQAHVNGELVKEVKKKAIDKDITVNAYVEKALRTQLEIDRKEESEEAEKCKQDNLTITDNKTQGE